MGWTNEKEEIVCGPYDYLKKVPGKDLRAQLIQAFNSILKVEQKVLSQINDIIAMLHTASLIVDDVEDNGTLRRGVPVAHHVFGQAQTINASNYIMFKALDKVMELDASNTTNSSGPSPVQIYMEEMLNLHRGQGMDLYWRETYHCPTEEEYRDMVINKTGGLYRMAVRLMQIFSPEGRFVDLVPLANTLGVLYQVQDDYLNLQSQKYSDNKGFCEDLTEGKFSFPIIHSIRSNTTNKEMINILKQRTTDVRLKEYAVNYMEKATGSFEYTRRTIGQCRDEAHELVQRVATTGNRGYDMTLLQQAVEKLVLIEL